MERLVDAHIHISDDRYAPWLGEVLRGARACRILLLAQAVDIATSRFNIELGLKEPELVKPFVGIHPWVADREGIDDLARLLARSRGAICGIGEIGLDKSYVKGNEEGYRGQKRLLEEQLGIAERLHLATSIHSRGSIEDVLVLLGSHQLKGVCLHWFAGEEKQLLKATAAGYYISFGPALVYSKKLQRLASKAPSELLLVETDGPVSYGACFEDKMAWPTFLPSVISVLAKCQGRGYDEMVRILYKNACSYMGMEL